MHTDFPIFVSCVLLPAVFIKAQRILTLMKSNLPVFFLLQNMFFMAYLKTFRLTQAHKFLLQSPPKFLLNFWNFDSFRFSLCMRWYIHFEFFFFLQMVWNTNGNHLKTWLTNCSTTIRSSHCLSLLNPLWKLYFHMSFGINLQMSIQKANWLFFFFNWDCLGSLDNLGKLTSWSYWVFYSAPFT